MFTSVVTRVGPFQVPETLEGLDPRLRTRRGEKESSKGLIIIIIVIGVKINHECYDSGYICINVSDREYLDFSCYIRNKISTPVFRVFSIR